MFWKQAIAGCRNIKTNQSTFRFSSTAKPVRNLKWQDYVLRSTVIVVGLPVLVMGGFVYNLKSDPEFRFHFDQKYPQTVDFVRQYVEIDTIEEGTETTETRSREVEDVVAVVSLASGRRFRVNLKSDATMDEIQAQVLSHGAKAEDTVSSVVFEDGPVSSFTIEEKDEVRRPPLNTMEEEPTSTWPTERPVRAVKKIPKTQKIEWELTSIQYHIQDLQEECRSGTREIDSIQHDIEQLKLRQQELQSQLPRKKFLGLF